MQQWKWFSGLSGCSCSRSTKKGSQVTPFPTCQHLLKPVPPMPMPSDGAGDDAVLVDMGPPGMMPPEVTQLDGTTSGGEVSQQWGHALMGPTAVVELDDSLGDEVPGRRE